MEESFCGKPPAGSNVEYEECTEQACEGAPHVRSLKLTGFSITFHFQGKVFNLGMLSQSLWRGQLTWTANSVSGQLSQLSA